MVILGIQFISKTAFDDTCGRSLSLYVCNVTDLTDLSALSWIILVSFILSWSSHVMSIDILPFGIFRFQEFPTSDLLKLTISKDQRQ